MSVVIGTFENTKKRTNYSLFFGRECAELARHLYKYLDIEMELHDGIDTTLDVYDYIVKNIGISQEFSDTNIIEVTKDLTIMSWAFAVVQKWKGHIPLIHNPHRMLLNIEDIKEQYIVFYNYKEKKTIVVDGSCPELLSCMEATETFPYADWDITCIFGKDKISQSTIKDAMRLLNDALHCKEFESCEHVYECSQALARLLYKE
jgi:hypothetical protein